VSDPSSESPSASSPDQRLDLWLSWLLRGGTYLALLLIAVGLVINFSLGQSWIGVTDLSNLLGGADHLRAQPPANLAEIVYGFRAANSWHFVQAAILILILLPAFRVAFLFGHFIRRRDVAFSIFAAIVLATLLAGFFFRLTPE
jgi:uncharacterized membrane protein